VRIESKTEAGISDVLYCIQGHTGWLELKELEDWPKRASTPVRIHHLMLEQVTFLESWQASGGKAHLLLQVNRNYLLLTAGLARAIYIGATRAELEAQAIVMGYHHLPTIALVRALIS
jgi:hypothetical protein